MNMHKCPHCEEPGISALRKFFIGPEFPAKCKQCGQKVGVPCWSILTLVPMIVGITVCPYLITKPVSIAFFATFMTLTTWALFESFVPLQRR